MDKNDKSHSPNNSYTFQNRKRARRFKSIDEFEIIDKIGRGGYSVVYLAEHIKTRKIYALKCAQRFKKGKDRSERTLTEIEVLSSLDHPNIIDLKGWFEDDETIYLVLEYIPGKDCSKYFKKRLPTHIQIVKIIQQLVDAIEYIHNRNIIHRDVKLENILIDDEYNIKLTDFGLCVVKEHDTDIFENHVGTVRYTAPELLGDYGYNESVDIWGIGLVLFLLLTGKYPFDGSKKENIFRRIQEKKIRWNKYNLVPLAMRILRKLLQKDPYYRIEIEYIMDHPYFTVNQ